MEEKRFLCILFWMTHNIMNNKNRTKQDGIQSLYTIYVITRHCLKFHFTTPYWQLINTVERFTHLQLIGFCHMFDHKGY